MTVFFSSDTHFNLERVIRQCRRPFSSLEIMRDGLIANFNSRVGKDDDLIIVGDFAHKNADPELEEIFHRLNGRKHLVVGNHDQRDVQELPWDSMQDIKEMEVEGVNLFLCHYPLSTWKQSRDGVIHLFGHVHDNHAGWRNAINVGVDQWAYHPCTLPEILEKAKNLPVNRTQRQLDGYRS